MVAVRDEAVMAARRRDKQAAAEASNDFYPAGFDKAAEMRELEAMWGMGV